MNDSQVFVHPQAVVESDAIGTGTRIWALTHVGKGAALGADCNIGEGCYIEAGSRIGDRVTVKNGAMIWEGVTIGDDVFVGPGVVFTNDARPRSPRFSGVQDKYRSTGWLASTTVGRGASIGANCTISCGLSIGEFAMIGAGAVVTTDIPAHVLAFGNPARARGYVCVCGEKLPAFRKGGKAGGPCGLLPSQGRRSPLPGGVASRQTAPCACWQWRLRSTKNGRSDPFCPASVPAT